MSHLGREQDIHLLARYHSFTQARASLGAGMNMTISISPYQKSQLTSSEVALPGWIVLDESAGTILSPPSGKSIINSYNEWSPFKQGWLRPKHNKKGLEMANTEKIKGKASKPLSKHVWLVIGISRIKTKEQVSFL